MHYQTLVGGRKKSLTEWEQAKKMKSLIATQLPFNDQTHQSFLKGNKKYALTDETHVKTPSNFEQGHPINEHNYNEIRKEQKYVKYVDEQSSRQNDQRTLGWNQQLSESNKQRKESE